MVLRSGRRLASAACLGALLAVPSSVAQMSLLATGDWGGIGSAPYVNDVELANANAMAGVMADTSTVTPSFGLLMGDNFYSRGIDCQPSDGPDCVTTSRSHRFQATFEDVFDQPAFDNFPFYVILGNHDHYGNATAQLEYSQQHMGSDRWKFPAQGVDDLYYKLERGFTDPAGNSVTVDLFMIDTVQWVGLREQCYVAINATDEELRLLWHGEDAQATGSVPTNSFEDARAECDPQDSCCLLESYYSHLPPPPPPPSANQSTAPAGVTDASGSDCDEESFPDKDHGTICGECKVLVNHFSSKYGTCNGYCSALNRTCTGAWEESADTCQVKSVESCSWAGDTSDAICECGEAGTVVSAEPTCVDNVAPLRHYGVRRCEDVQSFCSNEFVAATCCQTCAPLTPWCAAHGIEEAEWSLRSGLKDPFLTLLGTDCSEVVANSQCSTTVQELFDTIGMPAGVGPASPDGLNIARQVSASGTLPLANHSCPESCDICYRGDDVHRPPHAPRLLGADWVCEAGPPLPGTTATGGQVHRFHFTCPQTDPRIGGESENAAPWSHDAFAARQRAWLDSELESSTADWKIVVGHYPVWSVAEHGPIPQLVNELKPLMERHGVSMYFNGHDHNAQHLNDGSNVEYFVVGAGAPVDPSRAHTDDVPAGACKFYWARSNDRRKECRDDPESGPDCNFDASIQDGSFAHVKFVDANTAEVELITHHGEVLYSVTKPNPRTQLDATGDPLPFRSLDRTQAGAEQKFYVPYKSPTAAPVSSGTSDDGGLSGIMLVVGLLTLLVAGAVVAKLCVSKQRVQKGSDGDEGIYSQKSPGELSNS